MEIPSQEMTNYSTVMHQLMVLHNAQNSTFKKVISTLGTLPLTAVMPQVDKDIMIGVIHPEVASRSPGNKILMLMDQERELIQTIHSTLRPISITMASQPPLLKMETPLP